MNAGATAGRNVFIFILYGLALKFVLFFPPAALAHYPLLTKLISAYNLKAIERSLEDGTYRGEAGILRIRPDIAKSLGMKVPMDQDYLDATELFKDADRSLEKAKMIMASRNKGTRPGEHAQRILDHFLSYKKGLASAKQRIMIYRSRLNPGLDERFDKERSTGIMDQLIHESLSKTDHRLRDALARFYNLCQGMKRQSHSLNPDNVGFVNEIFRGFIEETPEESLKGLRLDRAAEHDRGKSLDHWKKVMEEEGFPYISILETTLNKFRDKAYRLDPLLFVALMKRESNFDPLAVSSVGAVGLTQIMPGTALDLGMRKVYKPAYFTEGLSLIKLERDKRRRALEALFQIEERDGLRQAERARKLMQESLVLGREKERLFNRYRQDLLQRQGDDRLSPALAIEFGFRYFAGLMKAQKGDISLALASYNAGPHRVTRYGGIPPYAETVRFRNRVLEYYREYLKKVGGSP